MLPTSSLVAVHFVRLYATTTDLSTTNAAGLTGGLKALDGSNITRREPRSLHRAATHNILFSNAACSPPASGSIYLFSQYKQTCWFLISPGCAWLTAVFDVDVSPFMTPNNLF